MGEALLGSRVDQQVVLAVLVVADNVLELRRVAAMKSWIERWLADANLVTRDEFDAVREMAIRAREENETLAARIAELEARPTGKRSA